MMWEKTRVSRGCSTLFANFSERRETEESLHHNSNCSRLLETGVEKEEEVKCERGMGEVSLRLWLLLLHSLVTCKRHFVYDGCNKMQFTQFIVIPNVFCKLTAVSLKKSLIS